MDKELKREALRQYVKYFKVWFTVTGIALVVTIGAVVVNAIADNKPRGNDVAPTERVYDYADALTDSEEEQLRQEIAKCEQRAKIDIVIVTLNQPMGDSDWVWEDNMMNYADDFYDNGKYGWNRAYGDGVLLLDNWYEDSNGSQKGSWLSTSGKMEDTIGAGEENAVLDAMYDYIDTQPYRAYRAAVSKLADYGEYGYEGRYASEDLMGLFCGMWILPFIVAVIYAGVNMSQSKAKDTTTAKTYIGREGVNLRFKSDDFIRKSVTSHRIESSSSGGGGGSSHRGGGSRGSHVSSGGHSHGGGGRRR